MSSYPYIDRLSTLTFGGLKNGVFTLRKLLKKLGNPQDSTKVIHVAGTNGKWSTCQMISQVLWKEFGYKVGLTTSPHLIHPNERVQINGMMITDQELNNYLESIYQITEEKHISLSYFEHMILVAFLYFREQQVDYALVEVGLWGKYDATNVFTQPCATIITTISNDHLRILGPSLTHIFRNKVGIMKKNVPCYTRLNTPLMHYAAKSKKSPLHISTELIETNLHGIHQQENAWVAYTCLTTLWFDPIHVKQWLTHITHPWRTQWLTKNILLDGAHNEEWVRAFAAYVSSIRWRYTKVITIFWSTKTREDYPDFFRHLIAWDINYVVTPAIEHRAVSPDNYQHHLTFETIDAGTFQQAAQLLPKDEPDTLILIYGSLYLVGETLSYYQKLEKTL